MKSAKQKDQSNLNRVADFSGSRTTILQALRRSAALQTH
jgi:hypothetical protein